MIDSASLPNSESITLSGELRDKYRVLALLGQGGMSLVHIASAHSPGGVQKLVVLKSIRPELMRSEKVRGMFLDEARLATRLSHPNVVQTYEVVMISGRPVIVMEYMEGQSFFSLLRKAREQGGLSLAIYLHLLQEALLGLDYAHSLTDYDGKSLRLVHRDISPQNVFITYDGNAKILDFGIAKALNNSTQTESGELKGKIRYMAPEQMHAATDLDGRADVFSAGVMLWEALAERRIWQDSSDVDVIHAVVNAGIPRVSSVNPHVNPKLEAICMKALALTPDERWESAGHMQVALEEACAELGLRATRKDVSKIMKELFGETRAKLRASIDGRMKSSEGRLLDLSEGSDSLFVDELLSGAPD
jgi:serine/threonine protein kinase